MLRSLAAQAAVIILTAAALSTRICSSDGRSPSLHSRASRRPS